MCNEYKYSMAFLITSTDLYYQSETLAENIASSKDHIDSSHCIIIFFCSKDIHGHVATSDVTCVSKSVSGTGMLSQFC